MRASARKYRTQLQVIDTFKKTVRRFEGVVEAHESRYDIALFCTPAELKAKPYLIHGRSVIQIDTLRNSTSITVALAAGAKDVILYGKREDCLKILAADAKLYSGPILRAGEIEGQPIPEFDCGNSPLEFQPGKVRGRRVFYASTNNGSALALLLDYTTVNQVFWACMLNATTIGTAVRNGHIPLPLLFLCAGFRGTMAMEDMLCAGQILLAAQCQQPPLTLDDGARLAMLAAERYCDSNGNIHNLEGLCREMKEWRCGSVLTHLNQSPDIEATIYGRGIDPETLRAAKICIPRLNCKLLPPCIFSWTPPEKPSVSSADFCNRNTKLIIKPKEKYEQTHRKST